MWCLCSQAVKRLKCLSPLYTDISWTTCKPYSGPYVHIPHGTGCTLFFSAEPSLTQSIWGILVVKLSLRFSALLFICLLQNLNLNWLNSWNSEKSTDSIIKLLECLKFHLWCQLKYLYQVVIIAFNCAFLIFWTISLKHWHWTRRCAELSVTAESKANGSHTLNI